MVTRSSLLLCGLVYVDFASRVDVWGCSRLHSALMHIPFFTWWTSLGSGRHMFDLGQTVGDSKTDLDDMWVTQMDSG
jgi:hypothetical protein